MNSREYQTGFDVGYQAGVVAEREHNKELVRLGEALGEAVKYYAHGHHPECEALGCDCGYDALLSCLQAFSSELARVRGKR